MLKLLIKILIKALIFVAFVPGVLITLPPGGSRTTILLTHGVLYALTSMLIWKFVMKRLFRRN